MELTKLLGRNVRDWRKRRALSQEELALETGMKRSYVSESARGTRNPSVKAIARLATVLKIDPSELLKR
jgi:transcriptional regulator with XRE-family HTH domain